MATMLLLLLSLLFG
uniref:Uncharacterized protein n=1 Tax=Rhizophora mucronata TaxID=61149 RepID=A0A2P2JHY6_RHIMU